MYRYCGRSWSQADIESIRDLIAGSPQACREALAGQVCALFDWRRPNGEFRLMSCKVALLRMYRSGLIRLPPPRTKYNRPRQYFASPESDPQPSTTFSIGLVDLGLELVARGKRLSLWNEFIGRYHYLGYRIMPGAQLRYFIVGNGRVLGAMGFGGAAWKVAPRDQFIGWTIEQRESRLHFIVNQTRFLILPWVRCQNLATKSLALVRRRIGDDWETRYGYRPALLETFVDITRFQGTCYKADNWTCVGHTKGRSRMDRYHKNDQPVKSIWLMPLKDDFRQTLLGLR